MVRVPWQATVYGGPGTFTHHALRLPRYMVQQHDHAWSSFFGKCRPVAPSRDHDRLDANEHHERRFQRRLHVPLAVHCTAQHASFVRLTATARCKTVETLNGRTAYHATNRRYVNAE